jgi:tetratricopeptide (TPR) repeat protein
MVTTRRLPYRLSVAFLLAALIAIAYGGSLWNELVFDDRIFMEHDTRLRSLDGALRLFVEPLWGFSDDDGRTRLHQYYRPLQTLPLALSYAAFAEAAWPSHLLNLVLHWVNTLMVFVLARGVLGEKGSRVRTVEGSSRGSLNGSRLEPSNPRTLEPFLPAAAVAAIFAVHPGYSEAILWISNVAGLGVAGSTLAILLLHMSPWSSRWSVQLAIALLFLIGLWFKEAGVLAPLVLVLYDALLAPERGWRRVLRSWRRYAVFLPPFAIYYALRLRALGGALPGFDTVPLSGWELLINAVALLPQYVATLVWPVDLNMYHDFNAIHGVSSGRFLAGAGVLAGGAVFFVATMRRRPVIAFGVGWAFLTAAPHLLARWPQLNVFAERYLYLPAVGVLLAVAAAGQREAFRHAVFRRAGMVALGALLASFVVIDIRRTRDWHDEVTLYTKTLRQSERAELIRINLALRFHQLGRYDEGIALLRELLSFDDSWQDAWHNLGLLYLAKEQLDDARLAFEAARQRDPFNPATLLNLGYLYDRAGRREEALDAYFRALQVQPGNTQVWYNLAVVALELQQRNNARRAVEEVLRRAPGDQEALVLRRRLETLPPSAGGEPVAESEETLRLCAGAKRAVDEGRYADAIVALRIAAWRDERSPLPYQYLANVYYLTGRAADAVRAQREALQRDPENDLYRRNLAALEEVARRPHD